MAAPTLLAYATEQQLERHLRPAFACEEIWCQMFSEPGAGSDLAALSTRAVRDGDEWVINGQKVWTTQAHVAKWGLLLTRTDTEAPKHKGISVVLVDMSIPGITVRPLAEIVQPEHPDLNEVFFSDVLVPKDNLVGQMNNGWAMASGSLAHERGMVWLSGVMQLESSITALIAEAPAALARLDPAERAIVADGLVQSAIDATAARCLGYRGFAKLVRGGSAPEQALMKAFSSESRRRLTLRAAELGADRTVDVSPDPASEGTWIEQYFTTFGGTISAGSSEIQRNIIAEKVLGLPR
jgi:alkylation response protein AidB-like acyl-CoA dehydrogenase